VFASTKMAAGSTSSSSGNQQKLTAGSRVSCTTYNGEKVEGEVLAFDNHHKILVLSILFIDIASGFMKNLSFILYIFDYDAW
jgi:hypothetical protein